MRPDRFCDSQIIHIIVFDNYHTFGNILEASLWGVIAFCLLAASFGKPQYRKSLLVAALAFLLFGLSDLVEISTGAWWRPWWLLVWKAVCLGTLFVLWILYRRSKRSQNQTDRGSVN